MAAPSLPLSGLLVVDVSRMLPGAILVRNLVDLGARVIKVEDPAGGDPLRYTPPLVDGTGVGFHTFFHGVESFTLDLREAGAAGRLLRLSRHADVFIESFRPGTLSRWGLGIDQLRAVNPALVSVSLSSFGPDEPWSSHVGHDLNFTAGAGLLGLLGGQGVPAVQLADVTTGLLALSSLLAALLSRQRTGKGLHIDQPIALSPLPFVAWNLAEASVADESFIEGVLGGQTPTYRRYRCADGREITLGAIEPKFWSRIVDLLGIPEHAGDGLSTGDRGKLAAKALEQRFATQTSEHWVKLGEQEGLPITPLRSLKEVLDSPYYSSGNRLAKIPAGDSGSLCAPASVLSPFRREPSPAPRLGEGNVRIASEFGLDS